MIEEDKLKELLNELIHLLRGNITEKKFATLNKLQDLLESSFEEETVTFTCSSCGGPHHFTEC